ncbi:MAG: class I SAM-dependent methyltransferase [Sneathiella sp.]
MLVKKIHSAPPILIMILVQGGIFFLLSALEQQARHLIGFPVPFFWLMVGQGCIAAGLTYILGFSYWWVLIQLFSPPLLVLALAFSFPVWLYPVILGLLLMTFWNVAINRVPLYLTNTLTADKLADFLPKKEGLKVADLGSGLGGTMRYLGQSRPKQYFAGIESAPVPFLISWLLNKGIGSRNVQFIYASFWKLDLSEFDVLYCFLSPVPMPDLFVKAKAEMKPGSLFISNSFDVPGLKPDRVIKVKDGRQTRLLVWKI